MIKSDQDQRDPLTKAILGAAIDVHRALGPGLLESVYEECLCHELTLRKLSFRRQAGLPVKYKAVSLDCGYRINLIVAERVVVELKSVESIQPIHRAQLLTYLKLTELEVGLLINFNVPALRHGIVRMRL